MKSAIFTALLLPAVAILGVPMVSRWSPFEVLGVEPASIPEEITALKRSTSPNDFLMAPPGFFTAEPDEASPIFKISLARLRTAWFTMINGAPRTRLVARKSSNEFHFEQRTPLLKFPDRIVVKFIPLSENHSTLAIYSRSLYGRSDLGANKRRIQTWLELLKEHIPAPFDYTELPTGLPSNNVA